MFISLSQVREELGIGTSTLQLWLNQLGIQRHKLDRDRKQTYILASDLPKLKNRKSNSRLA